MIHFPSDKRFAIQEDFLMNPRLTQADAAEMEQTVDSDPFPSDDAAQAIPRVFRRSMVEIQRDLALGLLKCESVEESLEMLLRFAREIPVVQDCGIAEDESEWHAWLSVFPQMNGGAMIWLPKQDLPVLRLHDEERKDWKFMGMIPLQDGERMHAEVIVYLREDPASDPDLVALLEGMAAQTAGAISRIVKPSTGQHSGGLETALNASEAGTWSWEVGNGHVVWDNRNRRLFGMEDDSEVSVEEFTNRIHSEDRDRIIDKIRELAEPGGADEWNNEFRIMHPTAGERWLAGLGRVERDARGQGIRMSGINIDITDRKRVELSMREWNQALEKRVAERTAELNQSEARFRLLAEATFEGISVCENGILLDCNPQLARMLGYDLDEMIGMPVMDLIAPESHDLVERNINCGQEVNYEFLGLRKDGSTFPVEAHACRRMWKGKETRVSAIRDLTETKRAAARLQAQQTELYQAQRLALVSEVSAGIVHQIGQPLAAIGINLAAYFATILNQKDTSCACVDIMKEIDADVARMRSTIIHLRALADPEKPNRTMVNLNCVVGGVVGLLKQESKGRGVEIEVIADPSLPECMMDSIQMSQVVLNLLKNSFEAVESMPPERKRIVISTGVHHHEWLEMMVSDKGCGISPETLPQLFSPFFSTKPEGIGIGLRLSRTIVNAHGGLIEAIPNPDGEGVTFRLLLPRGSEFSDTKV